MARADRAERTERDGRRTASSSANAAGSANASWAARVSGSDASRGRGRSGSSPSAGASRSARGESRYTGWRTLLNPLWCYWGFMASVIVVTIFGLLMVFSSSSVDAVSNNQSPWSELIDQGIFCAVGFVAAGLAMRMPQKFYQRLGGGIIVFAWLLQALTFTPLGKSVNGNNGWIHLGQLSFQPAEFLKLALCIWLPAGMILCQRRLRSHKLLKAYAPALVVSLISFGLVMAGKDLGTAMIIVLLCAFAFLIGGFPIKVLLAACGAGVVGIVAMFVLGSSNRMQRILATYGTCTAEQAQGVCFQSIHGTFAMGSGGLFGVGLGNSREKWNYLPEAHNDFIFAIIGEELGFVGATLLVLGFVTMGWCLVSVALQCRDAYARMVMVCIAGWIVGQALINIAVVLGMLPVMGLPMPFVSSGGSALVMCLAASGVAVRMMRAQPDIKAALAKA
ncbi:peptidoglycan glycosyltransferase FtsW [Bifidobacterium vespertilionis]|uniref:peptidoglycan glycosyltransferase FtsW n=1 Tax=Bifidobacterium vespertilionis TaxID=2562524 RepID=UPI001BDD0102|nr:putative peptidoglycan glycosyltransferase FtsW [Bifidobacterium vespertilionis]MBT1179493.1 cell division protein FtsW [Bifidobacterium vespertilionis]